MVSFQWKRKQLGGSKHGKKMNDIFIAVDHNPRYYKITTNVTTIIQLIGVGLVTEYRILTLSTANCMNHIPTFHHSGESG